MQSVTPYLDAVHLIHTAMDIPMKRRLEHALDLTTFGVGSLPTPNIDLAATKLRCIWPMDKNTSSVGMVRRFAPDPDATYVDIQITKTKAYLLLFRPPWKWTRRIWVRNQKDNERIKWTRLLFPAHPEVPNHHGSDQSGLMQMGGQWYHYCILHSVTLTTKGDCLNETVLSYDWELDEEAGYLRHISVLHRRIQYQGDVNQRDAMAMQPVWRSLSVPLGF